MWSVLSGWIIVRWSVVGMMIRLGFGLRMMMILKSSRWLRRISPLCGLWSLRMGFWSRVVVICPWRFLTGIRIVSSFKRFKLFKIFMKNLSMEFLYSTRIFWLYLCLLKLSVPETIPLSYLAVKKDKKRIIKKLLQFSTKTMSTVSASSKNKTTLEWPAAQTMEPSKSGMLKSENTFLHNYKFCWNLKITERKSFFFILFHPNLFPLQNYNLNRFA